MSRKNTWLHQIVTIENKGYAAFLAGETVNPYHGKGYRNQNGPGGSLQRQRWEAWGRGWSNAKRDSQTKENHGDNGKQQA